MASSEYQSCDSDSPDVKKKKKLPIALCHGPLEEPDLESQIWNCPQPSLV